MINFKISYHNTNLEIIKKKLNDNAKTFNDINKILSNLTSLTITNNTTDLNIIKNIAKIFIENKDTFIVFGTGGSSLGAKALINILQGKFERKVLFFDNIDPIQFRNSILELDLIRTGFIIISKSGSTVETLSQLSSIIEIFKSQNITDKLSQNFVVITENKDSPLKRIANKLSCKTLDHENDIGGRYSVFSNVGLFPAFITGLDILKIREGAMSLIEQTNDNSFNEHLIGASVAIYLQSSKSINTNVLITYTDALYYFGKWYLQLWAESIGKKGKGITPIHSIGTTDQHSQLQLYIDGPKDKFFSLITTNYKNQGLKMNEEILKENGVDFLAGKTMGDLMYAEQQSTLKILIEKGLPVREIYCNHINEFTLGQILAYFMMETITACHLIGVDPFNQPAVEQGKKLTKDYLQ